MMEAILLRSESKTKTRLLLQLAKQLNVKTSKLSSDELENIGITFSIEDGLNSGFLSEEETNEFVSRLTKS